MPAANLALQRAGIRFDDLDIIELNEAFAVQVLACLADWGIATYLEDIDYIRRTIALLHPHHKPFVGGLSLGAVLSLAAAYCTT